MKLGSPDLDQIIQNLFFRSVYSHDVILYIRNNSNDEWFFHNLKHQVCYYVIGSNYFLLDIIELKSANKHTNHHVIPIICFTQINSQLASSQAVER